ncbi:MAG: Pathogenicity cluster 5 protein d [Trichoglossum hirsutum]|nr:MAG: Pathogenicity cluster 5 protein d [Trichoglossum hirsutum]
MGGNFSPTKPLDAQKFLFFKGINDAGDGKGNLQATVKGGLPAGKYRVCTIGTSFTHQPALMPVARRGAQDDCQKFSVA